jgi:hypothetical protein
LRNRAFILIVIAGITVALGMQWKHMRFTYTEANLLPDDHKINLEYKAFLDQFGEEGNLIVLGVKDSTLFTPEKFSAWNRLSRDFRESEEVELTLSIGDLQKLTKRKDVEGFEMVPLIEDSIFTQERIEG